MRKFTIPSGLAHFQFDANLGTIRLRFRLNWLTRFGYYVVDVSQNDKKLTAGRGLHPGIDLLRGLNLDNGTLTLEGSAATPENMGIDNRLVYREEGE